MVLALPEVMHQANAHFVGNEEYNVNYCSGIFNTFLAFGQVVGPLFGSNLVSFLGFRHTQDLVALLFALYGICYLCLGGGAAAFGSLSASSRRKWHTQQASLNLVGDFSPLEFQRKQVAQFGEYNSSSRKDEEEVDEETKQPLGSIKKL